LKSLGDTYLTALTLLTVLILAFACSSEPELLRVFAAAGAQRPIDEAAELFRKERGAEIDVSYGGAGEVLARMAFAGMGDVYIAPEQRFMQSAVDRGAVDPTTIEGLAYMVPVLAVQEGNPKGVTALSDLARPGIRVAVTRPETTLLGQYAPEIFQKAGLENEINKNLVTKAARPDLLVTWLMLGEVDAVITWHLYAHLAGDEIQLIPLLPDQLTGIAEMQAAVATYSRSSDLAQSFVRFLSAVDGQEVFRKYGYIVDAEELQMYWTGPRE
jgi:molybdate transport system substrate-binding protein